MKSIFLILIITITLIYSNNSFSQVKNIYFGEVYDFVDGDNIKVKIKILPNIEYSISVRINGVDTPEIRLAKCPEEKVLGKEALKKLKFLFKDKAVRIENMRNGKFAGRVIADVYNSKNQKISDVLIKENLGRFYNGKKRLSWCE